MIRIVKTALLVLGLSVVAENGTAEDLLELPLSGASQSDFELLFIGNSHSAANGLPGLVTTLIEKGSATVQAGSGLAPGYRFLADRLNDGVTQQTLDSRTWTHVVLQAQKYSSTGRYYYPTDAAEEWIRRVKSKNAMPILFPEWPRRGNTEEGPRIHNLHLSISTRESACVAPVGLAWEESIAKNPSLDLHAPDGNHSNINGALLSAYVFYQVITGQPASSLPYVPGIKVSAGIQQQLRKVATTVTSANQATCAIAVAALPLPAEGIPASSHWAFLALAFSVVAAGVLVLRH